LGSPVIKRQAKFRVRRQEMTNAFMLAADGRDRSMQDRAQHSKQCNHGEAEHQRARLGAFAFEATASLLGEHPVHFIKQYQSFSIAPRGAAFVPRVSRVERRPFSCWMMAGRFMCAFARVSEGLMQMWRLIQEAIRSWQHDYASSMGAALAYYTLFSIAPLLLIVLGVAGFFFGSDAARGEIFSQLQSLVGDDGARAVEALLARASKPAEGIIASLIGFVTMIIGATTVFGELQNDLDRIWRAPAAREGSGILALVRARLLSFGMILGIAFLLMVSLVFSAALAALGKWWAPLFGGWSAIAEVIDIVVSLLVLTVLFAMIYKIMPRVHIRWHDVWIGAAVTAFLFTIGKVLIGLYIGRSGVASAYGAAASLVVVMVWVYYSAQVFLLGAEFTWVYAHSYGSRKDTAKEDKA
jgi:membrane protein